MPQLSSTDLKRLHRAWHRRTEGRLGLILDGVQSPFNVGAIVRTAAALRVETVYRSVNSAALTHPLSRRLSMGTERYLNTIELTTGSAAVDAAHADGYRVVAVELADEAGPLHEIDLRGDVCLALGNEDHGLAKDTLARADAVGFLPQLGKVGSLNVATAAGMALYEVRRQGWTR